MKAIIIHNHTVINIPRKGKQIEPTKEQMLLMVDNQIKRREQELKNWKEIRETVEKQD